MKRCQACRATPQIEYETESKDEQEQLQDLFNVPQKEEKPEEVLEYDLPINTPDKKLQRKLMKMFSMLIDNTDQTIATLDDSKIINEPPSPDVAQLPPPVAVELAHDKPGQIIEFYKTSELEHKIIEETSKQVAPKQEAPKEAVKVIVPPASAALIKKATESPEQPSPVDDNLYQDVFSQMSSQNNGIIQEMDDYLPHRSIKVSKHDQMRIVEDQKPRAQPNDDVEVEIESQETKPKPEQVIAVPPPEAVVEEHAIPNQFQLSVVEPEQPKAQKKPKTDKGPARSRSAKRQSGVWEPMEVVATAKKNDVKIERQKQQEDGYQKAQSDKESVKVEPVIKTAVAQKQDNQNGTNNKTEQNATVVNEEKPTLKKYITQKQHQPAAQIVHVVQQIETVEQVKNQNVLKLDNAKSNTLEVKRDPIPPKQQPAPIVTEQVKQQVLATEIQVEKKEFHVNERKNIPINVEVQRQQIVSERLSAQPVEQTIKLPEKASESAAQQIVSVTTAAPKLAPSQNAKQIVQKVVSDTIAVEQHDLQFVSLAQPVQKTVQKTNNTLNVKVYETVKVKEDPIKQVQQQAPSNFDLQPSDLNKQVSKQIKPDRKGNDPSSQQLVQPKTVQDQTTLSSIFDFDPKADQIKRYYPGKSLQALQLSSPVEKAEPIQKQGPHQQRLLEMLKPYDWVENRKTTIQQETIQQNQASYLNEVQKKKTQFQLKTANGMLTGYVGGVKMFEVSKRNQVSYNDELREITFSGTSIKFGPEYQSIKTVLDMRLK